jgi:hypothetical protein
MTRMRILIVACVLLVALAPIATAATPVRATLTTSTREPLVGAPWRYTITVRDAKGRSVPARARLQLLVGTLVVGCWKSGAMTECQGARSGSWLPFEGRRTGVLEFPPQSVGVTLVFQATIVAGGRVLRLRTPIRVQPAP